MRGNIVGGGGGGGFTTLKLGSNSKQVDTNGQIVFTANEIRDLHNHDNRYLQLTGGTIDGSLNVNWDLLVGTVDYGGNVWISEYLDVNGNAHINNNLTVEENCTIYNNLHLGGKVTSDLFIEKSRTITLPRNIRWDSGYNFLLYPDENHNANFSFDIQATDGYVFNEDNHFAIYCDGLKLWTEFGEWIWHAVGGLDAVYGEYFASGYRGFIVYNGNYAPHSTLNWAM